MLMNRIQRGAGKGKEESKQIPRFLGLNQYITCGVISQLKWEKQGEKEVWKEDRTREAENHQCCLQRVPLTIPVR